MQGSRENPILLDDSSYVKLLIAECPLLPRHFAQHAQKELERYCLLYMKGKAIQAKLDNLARQSKRKPYVLLANSVLQCAGMPTRPCTHPQ